MKKIINMVLIAAMILGTTLFSSCGSDNDETNNGTTIATGLDVNPLNVFTNGIPKSIDGFNFLLNAKGQVSEIKSDDETVTFEYKDVAIGTSKSPNVIMTIEDKYERLVFNMYLDRNGFVTHCDETEYSKTASSQKEKTETWDFTYNTDGQLLTMVRSENDNRKNIMKYQDGNIVEITSEFPNDPSRNNSDKKVYYTSSTISSPIENKGCIMFFVQTFGIDIDQMEYAYFAGMLGKATKNLPIKLVDGSNEYNFLWTLNPSGYPVSVKDNYGIYTFTW